MDDGNLTGPAHWVESFMVFSLATMSSWYTSSSVKTAASGPCVGPLDELESPSGDTSRKKEKVSSIAFNNPKLPFISS